MPATKTGVLREVERREDLRVGDLCAGEFWGSGIETARVVGVDALGVWLEPLHCCHDGDVYGRTWEQIEEVFAEAFSKSQSKPDSEVVHALKDDSNEAEEKPRNKPHSKADSVDDRAVYVGKVLEVQAIVNALNALNVGERHLSAIAQLTKSIDKDGARPTLGPGQVSDVSQLAEGGVEEFEKAIKGLRETIFPGLPDYYWGPPFQQLRWEWVSEEAEVKPLQFAGNSA